MAFENTSANKILSDFFASMGLQFDSELSNLINDAMIAGYGPDKIELIMPDLQKTKAFKNRFPGFDQRISNGYNAISLGDYLNLENQYHRILQESGLPAGFYDDPADFGKWIAGDVSPQELTTRVQIATDAAQKIDPTTRNLMATYYGLSTGDLASYFLDQSRALPVIQRQYNAANIATHAAKAGLGVNDMQRYERLADQGVTSEQAASGFGTVKTLSQYLGQAAGIYGETYDQGDAEQDVFFNKSEKRQRIMGKEAATFSGKTKGDTGSGQRNSY